ADALASVRRDPAHPRGHGRGLGRGAGDPADPAREGRHDLRPARDSPRVPRGGRPDDAAARHAPPAAPDRELKGRRRHRRGGLPLPMTAPPAPSLASNFIRALVEDDMRTNRWDGRVVTRFPPEPNGYLH